MNLNENIKNKSIEKDQAANILYQTSRFADQAEYNLNKTKNNYELAIKEKELCDQNLNKAREDYIKLSKELDNLTKEWGFRKLTLFDFY
jgi:hypothetical protein